MGRTTLRPTRRKTMRGKPLFTNTTTAHIRRLYASGVNINELARRFSVSRDVIDNIVSNHLEYKPVKAVAK